MNKIQQIYKRLYKTFGPQKWWPTTLEGELHPTYHGNKKLNESQVFEIIVGSILTQNTAWKNVEKAIMNLNKKRLIDINKIKTIKKQKLARLIKPSGYYNQKAERLKIVADFFGKNKIQKLKKQTPEKTREHLLSIKGIGPETADSIILYAFNKPVFVVDSYTKKVFSRAGICKNKCSYDELQEIFHKSLPRKAKLFNEYHALIVELGKRYCTKKPNCAECPVNTICRRFIKRFI